MAWQLTRKCSDTDTNMLLQCTSTSEPGLQSMLQKKRNIKKKQIAQFKINGKQKTKTRKSTNSTSAVPIINFNKLPHLPCSIRVISNYMFLKN